MKRFLRFLSIFFSLAVGCVFLYSAFTKTFPIEPFEYTLVEFLHFPWFLASVTARFMVGLEAGIGLLMVANLAGRRKWILKFAAFLLLFFSIYICYIWAYYGSKVNCGCFGDAIWMSPQASLIKNGVLLIVVGLLIDNNNIWSWKWYNKATWIVLVAMTILPFILFIPPANKPDWQKTSGYTLDWGPIYASGKTDTAVVNPGKGKYIVAFLSQYCSHCKMAAYKMHLMKIHDPTLRFFFVIAGTPTTDLSGFFRETKAGDIPYVRLEGATFMKYTGGEFPKILWVNDSRVEAQTSYLNLNEGEIRKWEGN